MKFGKNGWLWLLKCLANKFSPFCVKSSSEWIKKENLENTDKQKEKGILHGSST